MAYNAAAKLSGPVVVGYDLGNLVACPFSFATNGASDPSTTPGTGIRGDILNAVVHTATGKYIATLDANGYEIVAVTACAQIVGDSTDIVVQVGTIDTTTVPSRPTIILRTMAGATATDVAADANNRVNCVVWLRKFSVSRRRS